MEIWLLAFLFFYWLIGFISFIIIIYILVSSPPPSKVMPPKVIVINHKVPPPLPTSCHSACQFQSLYGVNFSFDLHALLRENETDLGQESELLWTKRGLTYGDLQSVHRFITNVSIPEVSDTH